MRHYKSTLVIPNGTKFFLPAKTRTFNTIPSPYSWMAKVNKVQSYETRLYYEYLNCINNDGQVFFFTLTYNDAHVPHYDEQPCFDYNDLRGLFTGGFYKNLQRNYGIQFKYFVSAELGDGKGVRGYHNNPHYHVLFFTYPSNVPDTLKDYHSYVKIDPVDFRHLVRLYWQGFDQDTDGFKDFRKSKLGIVSEGKYGIAVTDFRGIFYCAKYVTKDATLSSYESIVENKLRFKYEKYRFSPSSYREFILSRPDIVADGYIDQLGVSEFDDVFNYNIRDSIEPFRVDYCKFCDDQIESFVQKDLAVFRNRFCNKCRISNGVGDYALSFFDKDDYIQVPSSDGIDVRKISLYYYRKKYTRLVKKYGKIYRVLNDAGIKMKVDNLPRVLLKVRDKVIPLINLLASNKDVFSKFVFSRFNKSVSTDQTKFVLYLKSLSNVSEIAFRYAVYKTVYAFRFYHVPKSNRICGTRSLNFFDDYRRFLSSSIDWMVPFDNGVADFLNSSHENFVSYSEHPYFHKYIKCFDCLDDFSDYLFVQKDDVFERDAKERESVRCFHVLNDISSTVLKYL